MNPDIQTAAWQFIRTSKVDRHQADKLYLHGAIRWGRAWLSAVADARGAGGRT